MISFSASRIAASISAGHLPIRLVELRCGCFGPLLRFHVHHHHALRRAVQVNLPSGKQRCTAVGELHVRPALLLP
jgi:hypothetical protein